MALDPARRAQLDLVRSALFTCGWITLRSLAKRAGDISEASASARVRDLRKPKYGGYTIEKRKRFGQLFEYRLALGEQPAPTLAHGKTPSEHAGSSV